MSTAIGKRQVRAPTPRQKRLARLVAENLRTPEKPLTTGALLVKAGYSLAQSLTPTEVTRSQGLQLALAELGLTKELVVPMLAADLENNPGRRWLGLSIAGKWLGLEQRQETQQQNVVKNAIIIIQAPTPPQLPPV